MKFPLLSLANAYRPAGLVTAMAVAVSLLTGCGGGGTTTAGGDADKPVVVSTIFAYYDAARAIGGSYVDAKIIIPPSASPHEYEPTVEDKVTVNKAKLLIINGLGIDERFGKLVDPTSGTTVINISQVVNTSDILKNDEVSLDVPPVPGAATAPATTAPEHEEEGPNNPHIWLDPMIQMQAAEMIRDAMIHVDGRHAQVFRENTTAYEASIMKLDAEFKAAVPTFKTRDFIGFHSAYEYLARRYGLHQLASIEEFPGEGITPAQAEKVIDIIKKNHITYVAKETAFSEKGADIIVRETGVKLITLQPLETYDNGEDTYVNLMEQNLKSLSTALGGQQ